MVIPLVSRDSESRKVGMVKKVNPGLTGEQKRPWSLISLVPCDLVGCPTHSQDFLQPAGWNCCFRDSERTQRKFPRHPREEEQKGKVVFIKGCGFYLPIGTQNNRL